MPSLLILFFRFVLGAIVGSFLNVVGLRYRSGLNLGGRSKCPSCQKPLVWHELLPILSFFLVRGRCSGCKVRISWQYPLVELWTALIFATVAPVYWLIFCFFVVIVIYDFRHKIIPNALVYWSIFFSVIFRIVVPSSLGDWLVGPILFALFAIGWFVSRGRALGFGDAKLSLAIGLLLGASEGASAIVLAFWVGALVTLPIVLSGRKKLTMKSEIPFAPFIILGAWGSLLFHLDLLHLNAFF